MEEKETLYPFFVETWEEEVRIRDQARRLDTLMPILDTKRERISQMERAFDLGCGSGTWMMDRAREFPGCHFHGLDLSKRMIRYAQVQAQANRVGNVTFQVGNALDELPFPDAHFDWVYARLIHGFMPRDRWLDNGNKPGVLNECFRILKPGGYVRLIECERPLCNKPVHTKFCSMAAQMGVRMGVSFATDGETFGICNMLVPMLLQSGFVLDARQTESIDYSWWSPDHQIWRDNTAAAMKQFPEALTRQGRPQQEIEEAEQLVQQALAEMDEPDFCATIFFLSVVARKPE